MKKFIIPTLVLSLMLGSVAFAEGTATSTQAGMQNSHGEMMKNRSDKTSRKMLDGACAGNAVEKRENSLIAGLDTFNSAMKTALTARTTSLKDAWSKTTPSDRNSSRRTGRQAFESSSKSARSALKEVRKSAWSTFQTDIKACGGTGMEETAPSTTSEATAL